VALPDDPRIKKRRRTRTKLLKYAKLARGNGNAVRLARKAKRRKGEEFAKD
jgi:hypothetical protein